MKTRTKVIIWIVGIGCILDLIIGTWIFIKYFQ